MSRTSMISSGIRVSSTVDGDETRYLIDTIQPYAQVLEEYTPGGVIKVSYVYGNDLISQNRAGVKSFYAVDGLGSTRALTNASGVVTDRYIYDAFGRTIGQVGSTANVYLFAGEQRDPNVGLDYLRARYLDVGTGRFYGRDPFGGVLLLPASLHRFLYAADDPADRLDPSGEQTLIEEAATVTIADVLAANFPTFVKGGLLLVSARFALQPSFQVRNLGLDLLISAQDNTTRNYAVDVLQDGNQLISEAAELTRNLSDLAEYLLIYRDFTQVTVHLADLVYAEALVQHMSSS